MQWTYRLATGLIFPMHTTLSSPHNSPKPFMVGPRYEERSEGVGNQPSPPCCNSLSIYGTSVTVPISHYLIKPVICRVRRILPICEGGAQVRHVLTRNHAVSPATHI